MGSSIRKCKNQGHLSSQTSQPHVGQARVGGGGEILHRRAVVLYRLRHLVGHAVSRFLLYFTSPYKPRLLALARSEPSYKSRRSQGRGGFHMRPSYQPGWRTHQTGPMASKHRQS